MAGWVSPRLGIRFDWQPRTELTIYRPDGQRFLSSVELSQRVEQERFRAEQARLLAEEERFRAEQAQLQAEQERRRAEDERLRAEDERLRAEQERSRAEQAEQSLLESVPRLLGLGLSVEQVATALGLPIATVQTIVDAGT